MTAAITCAPSGAQDRLARARRALKMAEERAGLRPPGALEVQRAMSSGSFGSFGSSASPASPASSVPGGAPAGSLAASLMTFMASPDSGVLSLQGSATLLLAVLALRQGSSGWCGVIGGDDLGWCAATEIGLDLNRVLSVPRSTLDDASTLTVASTLLDGVDALLIGASSTERLRPQHRRRLLARARERGRLILTPAPWEGARTLQAGSLAPDAGIGDGVPTQPPVEPSADGVVVPIGRGAPAAVAQGAGQAVEMPAGYLRRLSWTLTDPQRPHLTTRSPLTVSLSARGIQTGYHDDVEPAPRQQEAAG